VASDSYGQGSSREHAALCPMYLGVRAVIAKAIERMHFANLINFAVMPLVFADGTDYDAIDAGDEFRIDGAAEAVRSAETIEVANITRGTTLTCRLNYSDRQRAILLAGGLLNYTRQRAER